MKMMIESFCILLPYVLRWGYVDLEQYFPPNFSEPVPTGCAF